MSEPFPNVTGAGRYQTERDFDTQERTRDIRAKRNRRLRQHLTVDTDDSTAVLFRCGCVAGVKETRDEAKAWLNWLHESRDPDKWWGAYLAPAYAVFDGPVLTVYGRDDQPLPMPGRPSAAGCDTHAAAFDRRTA